MTPLFIIIGWSIASHHRLLFTSSTSDKEASDVYGMLMERSLTASLRIAVINGVGCDPPSETLSLLSLSRRDLHRRPSLVSARRGPRTRLLTCSVLQPLLTPPSPSSARCRSRPVECSLSASLHVAVVCGVVGCDPPSLTLLSLSPSRRDLCRRPLLVSPCWNPKRWVHT